MFKAKMKRQYRQHLPVSAKYGGKGSIAAGSPQSAEADLRDALSEVAEILRLSAEQRAETDPPALDALPLELREGLQEWRSDLRKWAAAGEAVHGKLMPLLQQVHELVRTARLAGAKFQIDDPVETPHGRGVVRDVLTGLDGAGELHYAVDGHLYMEDQLQQVAAVDRLGDLHEEP